MLDPQIKKKKWDWEKFCTYQYPEEEQGKRAGQRPKSKKKKLIKYGFWVLYIGENMEGLDLAIYVVYKNIEIKKVRWETWKPFKSIIEKRGEKDLEPSNIS